MGDLTIRELCRQSHENSKAHGFWDGDLEGGHRRFVPEKLMLIVSEAAEALEDYRKAEPDVFYVCKTCDQRVEDGPPSTPVCPICGGMLKPCGFASKLADVMIRVADLAERLGIDLERAIREKHAYNLTRPMRHGGKVC